VCNNISGNRPRSVAASDDKLIDWALTAISNGDLSAAQSFFEKFADRVRHINPELASFYERLLIQTKLNDENFQIPEASIVSTSASGPAIDRMLAASIELLKAGDTRAFSCAALVVASLYAKLLTRELPKIMDSDQSFNLSRTLDAIAIAEKVLFCLERLRVVTKDSASG
jgi:hypothetical protein